MKSRAAINATKSRGRWRPEQACAYFLTPTECMLNLSRYNVYSKCLLSGLVISYVLYAIPSPPMSWKDGPNSDQGCRQTRTHRSIILDQLFSRLFFIDLGAFG
jgi:hypothetical protein